MAAEPDFCRDILETRIKGILKEHLKISRDISFLQVRDEVEVCNICSLTQHDPAGEEDRLGSGSERSQTLHCQFCCLERQGERTETSQAAEGLRYLHHGGRLS